MDEEVKLSACPSLAALGMRVQRLGLWQGVAEHVKIKQKVLRYTPPEKLPDCFI